MKTVIGLFDTSSDAYAAQNELLAAGLARDRISVVTSEANKDYRHFRTDKNESAEGAGFGAATGALAGGVAGVLASLGVIAIPGLGLLGVGPLVAALTGIGIGAATGGLLGGLIGMGIPEHEAELYAEGIRRGATLVSVDAGDHDAQRVAIILSQHHAVDIDERRTVWETTGWRPNHTRPATPPPVPNPSPTSDPRSRADDRATTTGGMDPATSGIGTTRRLSSARIYNP